VNERRPDAHAAALRRARAWSSERTFAADALPDARALAERKNGLRVSVVLPALDEGPTVGAICRVVREHAMENVALVDELIVIDGGSTDATAAVAADAGARVVHVRDAMPEVPVVRGKGESLWRSLSVATGDIVCWIDADIRNFSPHFVTRLLAPLLLDEDGELAFVKGFYRRPLVQDGHVVPDGGGRVTELLARPLLASLFPELSCVRQPLAGEYAGRRDVLERLPFFTGYSVEAGLLIDLLGEAGLDAIAQADLTERVHRNRPLAELAPMARAIARTIMRRAREHGRIESSEEPALHDWDGEGGDEAPPERERPPLASWRASLGTLRARGGHIAALR
jgi:glucosyl-3-phosphoglycerate synthase